MADCPNPKPRGFSTICLPVSKERYQQVIDSPALYRQWLGEAFRATPELFPAAFASGYTLKDDRVSAKRGLRLRRIRCKADGTAFSVRPSFVLPYMTAWTDDAEGPLFLRSFGVPFWALARVFGKGAMFWYRVAVGFGRNSLVGTTVRRGEKGVRLGFLGGRSQYSKKPNLTPFSLPVHRDERNEIEVWPTGLAVGQALPVMALALRGAMTVPVDLEAAYAEALERSGL